MGPFIIHTHQPRLALASAATHQDIQAGHPAPAPAQPLGLLGTGPALGEANCLGGSLALRCHNLGSRLADEVFLPVVSTI